jgi:hypothetical protein
MSLYRMYVDEVGNSDYGASQNPNHRYLSLSGLVMDVAYVASTFAPALEAIKQAHFGAHPDERVVLHRREMLEAVAPFECLKDPARRAAWDTELLDLMSRTDFLLITVVIDKMAMVEQYRVWRHDPYHYAMEVLLERYIGTLLDRGATGNVLAEARGKKEDKRLKRAYQRIYQQGSGYRSHTEYQRALSSKELHFKTKPNNVPGLQFADLIAYPSSRGMLAQNGRQALPADFNRRVLEAVRSKYRRSPSGQISGWGQKWLP